MASGPCAAMTAVNRAWIRSRASSQLDGDEAPFALGAHAAEGVGRRPGPWTNSGYDWATLVQITPAV